MADENTLLLKPITEDDWPVIFAPGGLDEFYSYVASKVNEVPDVTTKNGIARVKSLAAMISASKKAVEAPGREYLRFLKEKPKQVEPVLKDWVERMDKLRDEVREPVTRLENEEKARIQALQERLSVIRAFSDMDISPDCQISTLSAWLADLNALAVDETLQEFQDEGQKLKDKGLARITAARDVRHQFERQQEELKKLAAEKAALEQAAREKEIAEKARRDAEEKAKREIAESEARAKMAEEQANRRAEEAARREKEAALVAEQRQKQAVENELARLAKIEADRIAADNDRAADVVHRRKVNLAIMEAVSKFCIDEKSAKALVTAMIKKDIPFVKVEY